MSLSICRICVYQMRLFTDFQLASFIKLIRYLKNKNLNCLHFVYRTKGVSYLLDAIFSDTQQLNSFLALYILAFFSIFSFQLNGNVSLVWPDKNSRNACKTNNNNLWKDNLLNNGKLVNFQILNTYVWLINIQEDQQTIWLNITFFHGSLQIIVEKTDSNKLMRSF